jgi:hypothetical protein
MSVPLTETDLFKAQECKAQGANGPSRSSNQRFQAPLSESGMCPLWSSPLPLNTSWSVGLKVGMSQTEAAAVCRLRLWVFTVGAARS